MFEKVNPSHPDKLADRIAGAIVDLAYTKNQNPKVAVEVLLGHGSCHIIIESSETFKQEEISKIVKRITKENLKLTLDVEKQDSILASNQAIESKCGDNGIFKGMPITQEQHELSRLARHIYEKYKYDGKYILNWVPDAELSQDIETLIICQSHAKTKELERLFPGAIINPLGDWTGGPNVDSGATNRKLGSDMGDAVTGGGLHGKDLSKADVSINIAAHIFAQRYNEPVKAFCAIGDTNITFITDSGIEENYYYDDIIDIARTYIDQIGGFEKLAEWGLI